MNKKLIEELNEIVDKGLSSADLPYKIGNSIRVGKFVIREKNDQYLIFNCQENNLVTKTYNLASALAIAKKLNKGKNVINEVLHYDKILNKHNNDIVFYKHTIKKTKETARKITLRIRFEEAVIHVEHAKQSLDRFIFD